MKPANPNLDLISGSPIHAVADQVRQLKARGIPVIGLQFGDPDFRTPEPIIRASYEAMLKGETHYVDSKGLPVLREAIAEKMQQFNGLHYDPASEIQVTAGGTHACLCTIQTVCPAGSELIIPSPHWPIYATICIELGIRPVQVPTYAGNAFFPTIEDLEKVVNERTSAILINTPSNPTGMVASAEYLQTVVDFAVRHDLYILSDEVYEYIIFDGQKHISLASFPEARPRTLVLQSFSKTYAMTGWRVGYVCGPAALVKSVSKVFQAGMTCVAPFMQIAVARGMHDPEVAASVNDMVKSYEKRRNLAMEILSDQPEPLVKTCKPQGAFYLFMDFSGVGLPVTELAARLLQEEHVAIVPGTAFGPGNDSMARATTAVDESDITEGLSRILRWCRRQKGG